MGTLWGDLQQRADRKELILGLKRIEVHCKCTYENSI
jgi:hypothetical protein